MGSDRWKNINSSAMPKAIFFNKKIFIAEFSKKIIIPKEKTFSTIFRCILSRREKVNWRIREKTNELKQSPPVNYVWDKSNFKAKFTVTYFSACILIRGRLHFMLEKCLHMWTPKFSFYRRNICVVVALLNKKKNQKRTFFQKEIFIIQPTNIFPKVRFSMNLQIKSSLPPPIILPFPPFFSPQLSWIIPIFQILYFLLSARIAR